MTLATIPNSNLQERARLQRCVAAVPGVAAPGSEARVWQTPRFAEKDQFVSYSESDSILFADKSHPQALTWLLVPPQLSLILSNMALVVPVSKLLMR